MASADICSSATTPLVYASTTQSICASERVPPVALGADDVDRRERHRRAHLSFASAGPPRRGPRVADAPLRRLLPLTVPTSHRPRPGARPRRPSTSARPRRPPRRAVVRARPQSTAVLRIVPGRRLLEDPRLVAGPAAGAVPVAGPDLPAAGACRGGRTRCRARASCPAGPAARVAGRRRPSRSSGPNACGSSSAIRSGAGLGLDQAVRAAVLPEQLPAPAARHQRQRRSRRRRTAPRAGRRRWRAAPRPRPHSAQSITP